MEELVNKHCEQEHFHTGPLPLQAYPIPCVDTTKTCSDPQRVGMYNGERPIGAAKGKQTNTMASCHHPPPPCNCLTTSWTRLRGNRNLARMSARHAREGDECIHPALPCAL